MKYAIAWIIAVGGVALGIYVGLWLMFIKPILGCCTAYDLGMLTGHMIGITIIKCLFATPVANIIVTVIGAIAKEIFKS